MKYFDLMYSFKVFQSIPKIKIKFKVRIFRRVLQKRPYFVAIQEHMEHTSC